MKKISIIIRTKNEEKWLGKCLKSVFSQSVKTDIEVIVVDNNSSDHTLPIAKRFPVKKIINISKFFPGKALNDGIKASDGDFIVCLSAHCIPKTNDWLQKMLYNFENTDNVAGVYGRQLPLSYTDPVDKRDLLIVFGKDKRVQIEDYFFHNANSMIPRDIWEKYPFDESLTNIEDRVWGKEVINAGYKLIYEPNAAVYHHHGLHQGNNRERVRGVVSILENVDADSISKLPEVLSPDQINVSALIPVKGNGNLSEKNEKQLKVAIHQLKKSNFVTSIYCLTNNKDLAVKNNVKLLDRSKIKESSTMSLKKIISKSLLLIEEEEDFPDNILYVNYDYINRPDSIFDDIIKFAQFNGFDTVFPGLVDYGNYWYSDGETYRQTDSSLRLRKDRNPLYMALYGLGFFISSWVIRTEDIFGGKIGILKLKDKKHVQRNLEIGEEV